MNAVRRSPVRWLGDHFAMIAAILVLLYLFLPVAYTFLFSFNDHGRSNIIWQGFTLEHWKAPCSYEDVCSSLVTSVQIAVLATVTAVVLGTLIALAMVRYRFRGRGAMSLLIFVPMATPEIVMGASLLTIFVQGFSRFGISMGFWTIFFSHIMFCLSYVVITVRARVQSLDPRLEEAAQDLYAGPMATFWRVTFPMILPGVLGGAMLAFALSFDDFIVTNFVSGDAKTFPDVRLHRGPEGVARRADVISFSLFLAALVIVLASTVISSLRKPSA